MSLSQFKHSLATRGWASTEPVIDAAAIASLREYAASVALVGRGGARNLLDDQRIRDLAASPTLRTFACAVLGDRCFAVRALLFDKTPEANWKVVWHQDLTISTQQRAEIAGYSPWTVKAGVPHVQPPVAVLQAMLALRLHLDPCGSDNGPVRVIDGTDRLGRIEAEAVATLRAERGETECVVDEGALLAFRPLLLHASAPATRPGHRRVIHIEYAATDLAEPLVWHRRVA